MTYKEGAKKLLCVHRDLAQRFNEGDHSFKATVKLADEQIALVFGSVENAYDLLYHKEY